MASEKSIGALWKGKGKVAFTGLIELNGEKVKLVVFENSYKSNDRSPDYKIYVGRQKEEKDPSEQSGLEPF